MRKHFSSEMAREKPNDSRKCTGESHERSEGITHHDSKTVVRLCWHEQLSEGDGQEVGERLLKEHQINTKSLQDELQR